MKSPGGRPMVAPTVGEADGAVVVENQSPAESGRPMVAPTVGETDGSDMESAHTDSGNMSEGSERQDSV